MGSKSNRLLTAEQDEFLRDCVKGISNQELTERMNQEFGLKLKVTQINNYKKNHHIHSGLTGRFEKGQVPWIKGKKFPGKINQTCFKKGNIPYNTLPVGTEVIRDDGYVQVKIAEPNKWKLKHVLLWEAENGKKPLNHVIVFADQNRLNFDLDNLILISRKELAICNRKRLLFPDPQLSRSGILVSKVLVKTKERREALSAK